MRIRFGLGLPGPFVLTSGRNSYRRGRNISSGALVCAAAVAVGFADEYPWLWAAAAAVVAVAAAAQIVTRGPR